MLIEFAEQDVHVVYAYLKVLYSSRTSVPATSESYSASKPREVNSSNKDLRVERKMNSV